VKPVSFERFFKSVQRARDYFELRNKNIAATGTGEDAGYFFIKADNVLVKVMHADILYAEALQNYIAIQTTHKKFISYLTFHALEAWLPRAKFLRTHKSFIVAADKIESIDGNDIRIGPYHVPISRNMKDEVMEKLVNGKFLKR
jgi:DNA-binding LytR/AlgR family response regulator